VVRGVNWLGDAVMTTPALIRLRERFPNAHIALLSHQKLADLWSGQPMINETLSFVPGESVLRVALRVRKAGFDLGLALPNSHRSALELWLAGIPCRVGLAAPFRSWMFTRAVPLRPGTVRMRKRSVPEVRRLCGRSAVPQPALPPHAHQVYNDLHLVSTVGAASQPLSPQLQVSAMEEQQARDRFGLDPAVQWLGLNPGAEYGPAKRWPAERFAAAAIELQKRLSCRWILLGGPGDVDLARSIARMVEQGLGGYPPGNAPLNLAGKSTLRELAGLLRCCQAVLSNDTGPSHLAAALGTRVIVPFGSTSPELTAPGLPGDPQHRFLRKIVQCSPCYLSECPVDHRCMTGISVEEVVRAVEEVLTAPANAKGPGQ